MNKTTINIIISIVCGMAVVAWLISRDFSMSAISDGLFFQNMAVALPMAVVCFALQNIFMSMRYELLSLGALRKTAALRVNFLCEFVSAATPSAVGGSGLLFYFIHREGVPLGRSTTIMVLSLFLDELIITLGCTAVVVLVPISSLLGGGSALGFGLGLGLKWITTLVLIAVGLWTAVLYASLFVCPQLMCRLIMGLFRIPVLRRFRQKAEVVVADIITSADSLKSLTPGFWIKAVVFTLMAWTFRFLIAVALLHPFIPSGAPLRLLAFARQWMIWLVAMVVPLPGGSGANEYLFGHCYGFMLPQPSLVGVLALAWRLVAYYPYLIVGGTILIKGKKAKRLKAF